MGGGKTSLRSVAFLFQFLYNFGTNQLAPQAKNDAASNKHTRNKWRTESERGWGEEGKGREEKRGEREAVHTLKISFSFFLSLSLCREAEADQRPNGQRSLGFHTPPLSATDSAHLSLPPPPHTPLLSPHPTASVCTTLFPWKAKRNIKLQLGEAPKNITSGRQIGIHPSLPSALSNKAEASAS